MNKINGLYAITRDNDPNIIARVQAALDGGANIVQFRDKSKGKDRESIARNLLKMCQSNDAILIINDDLDLAITINADGVHLGRHDLDIKSARKKIGDKIIGISCYNTLALAFEAEQLGADYVAFGRFFPSVTKPDAVLADIHLLHEARQQLSLPIVAIGGVGIVASNPDAIGSHFVASNFRYFMFTMFTLWKFFHSLPLISKFLILFADRLVTSISSLLLPDFSCPMFISKGFAHAQPIFLGSFAKRRRYLQDWAIRDLNL